jgi:hypothetical protein
MSCGTRFIGNDGVSSLFKYPFSPIRFSKQFPAAYLVLGRTVMLSRSFKTGTCPLTRQFIFSFKVPSKDCTCQYASHLAVRVFIGRNGRGPQGQRRRAISIGQYDPAVRPFKTEQNVSIEEYNTDLILFCLESIPKSIRFVLISKTFAVLGHSTRKCLVTPFYNFSLKTHPRLDNHKSFVVGLMYREPAVFQVQGRRPRRLLSTQVASGRKVEIVCVVQS